MWLGMNLKRINELQGEDTNPYPDSKEAWEYNEVPYIDDIHTMVLNVELDKQGWQLYKRKENKLIYRRPNIKISPTADGLVYEAYKKGFTDCFNSLVLSSDIEGHKILSDTVEPDSRERHITDAKDKRIVQFLKYYTFRDNLQIYSNGTVCVPFFRVLDALIQKGKCYQES